MMNHLVCQHPGIDSRSDASLLYNVGNLKSYFNVFQSTSLGELKDRNEVTDLVAVEGRTAMLLLKRISDPWFLMRHRTELITQLSQSLGRR